MPPRSPGLKRAGVALGAIGHAIEGEQREDGHNPEDAPRQVAPPARLLGEDALVDELERAHDCEDSAEADEKAGQDGLNAVRR